MASGQDTENNSLKFKNVQHVNLTNKIYCVAFVQGYIRCHEESTSIYCDIIPIDLLKLISNFIYQQTNIHDFIPLKAIGQGHIGSVRLVQNKHNLKYFALKTVCINDLFTKDSPKRAADERNFMIFNELNKIINESNKSNKSNNNNNNNNNGIRNLCFENEFLVSLDSTFISNNYIHFIMEYCHGCDLMSILMRQDILTEEEACFYIIEITLGLNAIHKMGFAYRGIKPDNILITKSGHIKLSDFGLCVNESWQLNNYIMKEFDSIYSLVKVENEINKSGWINVENMRDNASSRDINNNTNTHINTVNNNDNDDNDNDNDDSNNNNNNNDNNNNNKKRNRLYSFVGSPDYMSFEAVNLTKSYDYKTDYWALGALLYECVIGYPPFWSESINDTYQKILKWNTKQYGFKFTKDMKISNQCKNLIKHLLTTDNKRYNFDQIIKHEWFNKMRNENKNSENLQFNENIFKYKPKFIPNNILKSEIDTSMFDDSIDNDIVIPQNKIWNNNEKTTENELTNEQNQTVQLLFNPQRWYFDKQLYIAKIST